MSLLAEPTAVHAPRLRINTIRSSPTLAQVAVIGEVDLATAQQLRDRMFAVLYNQAPTVLDVDLAGVSFLDCAGIGALVAVRNRAVDAGQQIYVSHPGRIVRRLLDLTGLLGVLTAPTDRPDPSPSEPVIRPVRNPTPSRRYSRPT